MNMEILDDQDKTGDALRAQRFQILSDIARELPGEVVFPTYFDATVQEIRDLKSAISRLGLNIVNTAALSIVMNQLIRAKGMAEFSETTHSLWEHSIQTSAAAFIVAREYTRLNRDEAMLAGLIHDLGAF